MNLKKTTLPLGVFTTFVAPVASVIACGTGEPDLFVFTGKPENIEQFREIAKKFAEAYKKETDKEITIEISAVGNGVDTNQSLSTLMQRTTGKPDVITSFGIADVKNFVDGNQIKSIDLSSDEYKWAKSSGITSDKTLKRLSQNLSLKVGGKEQMFALPMAYESVGVVTRLDLLGEVYKNNLDETTKLTIGGNSIDQIIEKTDDDVTAGKKVMQAIFDTGWTFNEFKALGDYFKGGEKYVFATGGRAANDGWVSGFHAIPNMFSERNDKWEAFSNSYDTIYNEDLYDSGKSAFDSEAKQNPFEFIANQNGYTEDEVKKVIIDYYDSIYGEDMYRDNDNKPAAISMETSFKAFGDKKALFVHASIGMFSWMLGQINEKDKPKKLDGNNLVPIPFPLNTGGGNDNYKDIALGNGVLWHFIEKDDDQREELANQFIRFAMTGVAEFKIEDEDDETKEFTIEDATAPEMFFNSDASKHVNPYLSETGKTGNDLASEIIVAELKGFDWKIDASTYPTTLTDEVTIWTNGGNGNFGDNFGQAVLGSEIVGTKYTKDSLEWDKQFNGWKNRLNADAE